MMKVVTIGLVVSFISVLSLTAMQNEALKAHTAKVRKMLQTKTEVAKQLNVDERSVDPIRVPHTLYQDMRFLLVASEKLLSHPETLVEHPLYTYFEALRENGKHIVTFPSNPNIQQVVDLLLENHELVLDKGLTDEVPSVKIFDGFELFVRCLDIFNREYALQKHKYVDYDLSYSLVRTPLDQFSTQLIKKNPALLSMGTDRLEQFSRLLSVFTVDDDVVELELTLSLSVKEGSLKESRSFKPLVLEAKHLVSKERASKSNEISDSQNDLGNQIQNLDGSEVAMPYMKDADGAAQFASFGNALSKKELNIVDLGGGRGETNAVMDAVLQQGIKIHLLNVEPMKEFAEPYRFAHEGIGIDDVHILEKKAHDVSAEEIKSHFKGKPVDVVLASHFMYFHFGDLHKASCKSYDSLEQLKTHPLWKYFDILSDDGKIIVTLQTGSGGRTFRNMLLGEHGLDNPDETNTRALLKCLGNMSLFLKHYERFLKDYEALTGATVTTKMHLAVANVPLGEFNCVRDSQNGGYRLEKKPGTSDQEFDRTQKLFSFYANWEDLEILKRLTPDTIKELSSEELEKFGLESADDALIEEKRKKASESQQTYLHIARMVAPGLKNMQHPNITLEIAVSKSN